MADTTVKIQIVEKIKDSNNILVTVNSNPSVDELSAALGITLLINKLNKHGTAVFSGAVPPAIEFLQPEKTFENTVDSLRDFIIALDKEKADHLRYKVVDDMVKIFITPYRTTISDKDLDFSQGDYNVEFVLAIGVRSSEDLDKALESHGRILHDATVAAVSLGEASNLGGIEWVDTAASSYSEMMAVLADALKSDKALLDEQIATALLTGIVAATERFSNDKTSADVMTAAAQLMAAGANQQLIAIKLEEGSALPAKEKEEEKSEGDLQEDKPAKVDRSEHPAKEATPKDAPKEVPKDTPAADGSLAISHVPEGTLDEVRDEIASDQSAEAVTRAEEELKKQAARVVAKRQREATVVAEKELADNLAAVAPQPVQPAPLRGAVTTDTWRTSDNQSAEPTLGGTLNATSEQAAADKQREINDDRNKTILTHGGSSFVAEEPAFQAPINAINDNAVEEPTVVDVLGAASNAGTTTHVAPIQPPTPVAAIPTLAEIDAQNRAHQENAMAAVDAALTGAPSPRSIQSPQSTLPTPPAPAAADPLLPPLPPLPDFSTLPPLPGDAAAPTLPPFGAPVATAPAPVGSPNLSPVSASSPTDPAQFRIPGQ
jgi:hypothetical protein